VLREDGAYRVIREPVSADAVASSELL